MNGMLLGYARVSSVGQSLDVQIKALTDAGCHRIYAEKQSGLSVKNRVELDAMLATVREGDVVVVTRLDRLGRSVPDLFKIVGQIRAAGAEFRCIEQGAVDTTGSTGKLMFGVLAVVAEFEADLRRERQREGIENAKKRGVYDRKEVNKVKARKAVEALEAGMGYTYAAKHSGLSKSTIIRSYPEYKGTANPQAARAANQEHRRHTQIADLEHKRMKKEERHAAAREAMAAAPKRPRGRPRKINPTPPTVAEATEVQNAPAPPPAPAPKAQVGFKGLRFNLRF